MTTDEKICKLRNKILSYLERKEFLSNNEMLSFYDIAEACKKEFGVYSRYFKKHINKHANKINMMSSVNNFVGQKTPYISKVIPGVKNMTSYISIIFSDNNGLYCGTMNIIEDNNTPELIDFNETNFSNKKVIDFISKCYKEFFPILIGVRLFKKDFEMDYTWDLDKPDENSTLRVSDGFIDGKINLNDTDSAKIGLSNNEDMYLATIKHSKYGEVYDYVEFYNEGIQKRFPVDVESLNPLYKSIVKKHYSMDNDIKLTLR